MKYKLIIFDMDGTILNTLEDLTDGLNYALRALNLPGRTYKEVRSYLGNGIKRTIELSLPEGSSPELQQQMHALFTEYYSVHCSDKTKAYDGINELLVKLHDAGYKLAVSSNKADYAVKILCRQYFNNIFDISAGFREGISRKPAPDSVNEIIDALGIDKQHVLYTGDSEVDIATAANAGIDCVLVGWGYRDRDALISAGAKVIISSPDELLGIIK